MIRARAAEWTVAEGVPGPWPEDFRRTPAAPTDSF